MKITVKTPFSVEIMSDQEDRPSSGHKNASLSSINEGSPSALLPNPIITKRTRTQSMYFSFIFMLLIIKL